MMPSWNPVVRRILLEVVDLDPEAREAAIAGAELTPEVERELRHLLALHDAHPRFLEPGSAPETEPLEQVGPYRILEEVGVGATGRVYRATHTLTGQEVALKLLHATLSLSPRAQARLQQEARIGASLDHPHIATVHAYHSDGHLHYITSEFVPGPDLAEFLAGEDGASLRDPRRAVEVLRPVAEALAHAHDEGVTHRDIKPQNVLLGPDGPRLTDFGLALVDDASLLTLTGVTPGTVQYMSPEQAEALADQVDQRTDLFSFGIVLYECLTGRAPFAQASLQETLAAIARKDPPRPGSLNPAVPPALEALCELLLEKDRDERPSHARFVAEELARFAAGTPLSTRPRTRAQRIARQLRRRRRGILLSALALVAATVAGLLGWSSGRPTDPVYTLEAPPGTAVSVYALEDSTGEYTGPVAEGLVPWRTRLAGGTYRIAATGPDGQAAWSRTLPEEAPDGTLQLTLSVPDTTGMVRVPAGEFVGGLIGKYPEGTFSLPPFWIDRTEVTNAEYRGFVEATGAPAPWYWERVEDFAAIADRPVVAVPWPQARAYAEWRGKRLPTRLEWDRMARGPRGLAVPEGLPQPTPADACLGRVSFRPNTQDEWLAAYVAGACAVGTHTADRSAEGVRDVLGSAREWVDTPHVVEVEGGLESRAYEHCAKGFTWASRAAIANLEDIFEIPTVDPQTELTLGFRCALSLPREEP